jgi:hypothetical protein
VLSGSLTLSLAGETYDLAPGDAAHFDSRLPHRLSAQGTTDAEALVVASPQSGFVPMARPMTRQYRAIPAPELFNYSGSKEKPEGAKLHPVFPRSRPHRSAPRQLRRKTM